MTMTRPRTAARSGFQLPETEDEGKRLSMLRIVLAIVLIGGAAYGGFLLVRNRIQNFGSVPGTWFAPYVDVTVTPTYQFQLPANNSARQSVLGFIVAAKGSGCTPSWGDSYSLDSAGTALNLDSRIAAVRSEGASPIISFGGQKHTSLQVACTNQSQLTSAFGGVIDRYGISTIDLDVEGSALDNFAANRRLAESMRTLEASHSHLTVWLTLPVEPSGLLDNAKSLITIMLRDHVALAGVNIMAMDFNNATPGYDMLNGVVSSLDATHAQLSTLYEQYGVNMRSKILWNHMGATVMIGQNNQSNQVFTVADAQGVARFAQRTGLGRISFWSLNRDSQCGSSFAESGVLSNNCSGVAESVLGFSKVFNHLTGTVVGSQGSESKVITIRPDTNPADAPYPQWNGTEPYVANYKVVRQGFIYEAKWYNQGEDPATQFQFSYQSPWVLVGPVLPGSHAPKLARLPAGTYPQWTVAQSYQAGNRILYNGLPYQAKWNTEGASPAAESSDPSASPWLPLFNIPGEPPNT